MKLRILAGLGATAALLLVGAAPASAAGASIDPGDSLYAINCDEFYNDWQLLSVDPTTAFSTPVGDGTGGVDETLGACGGPAAYNFATGVSYYIQWTYDYEEEESVYWLATIDPATGDSVTIGRFFEYAEPEDNHPRVDSIVIGLDGTAYAIGNGYMYNLNLATAELSDSAHTLVNTWALAVDPNSGKFYAINNENELFELFAGGGTTFIDDIEFGVQPSNPRTYALQIDGSSRFWIEVDQVVERSATANLWSFTLADVAAVYSGEFIDDPYYTESLLIVPGDALPATGPTVGGAPLIAGGLLLAGVVAIGATVLIRRRAAA